MPVRIASAEWRGNLPQGRGSLQTETGSVKGSYSFASRFEEGAGTNPEELIAAAHAGCFSMALANALAKAGFEAESVRTTAKVYLEKGEAGFGITRIHLECRARVPRIEASAFLEHARAAKEGCPVSRALAATPIELDAALET